MFSVQTTNFKSSMLSQNRRKSTCTVIFFLWWYILKKYSCIFLGYVATKQIKNRLVGIAYVWRANIHPNPLELWWRLKLISRWKFQMMLFSSSSNSKMLFPRSFLRFFFPSRFLDQKIKFVHGAMPLLEWRLPSWRNIRDSWKMLDAGYIQTTKVHMTLLCYFKRSKMCPSVMSRISGKSWCRIVSCLVNCWPIRPMIQVFNFTKLDLHLGSWLVCNCIRWRA